MFAADFRSRIFTVPVTQTDDRSSRWQPWNIEAASRLGLFTTYVWWKTEASSGAIVRLPGADRPARCRDEQGEGVKRGPARSSAGAPWFTVDDIFSLALVGAYRTTAPDNGGPAWHFVSNYCSRGRSFLFLSPVRPLLRRARQCSILFCSIFILFCLFVVFFSSRYFSAAARSLLRRRATSTRIRPNFAALAAQIYNRDYAQARSRRRSFRRYGGQVRK